MANGQYWAKIIFFQPKNRSVVLSFGRHHPKHWSLCLNQPTRISTLDAMIQQIQQNGIHPSSACCSAIITAFVDAVQGLSDVHSQGFLSWKWSYSRGTGGGIDGKPVSIEEGVWVPPGSGKKNQGFSNHFGPYPALCPSTKSEIFPCEF